MAKVSANQRHRNPRGNEFPESLVATLAGPRRDYEAIGSVISQRIESLHIFFRRVFADADKESIATLLQHFPYSTTQLSCEGIRNIADHQTNRFRTLAFQAARQAVAAILQLADYLQNALASLQPNVTGTANHARNCHRRHGCERGYVGQRYLFFILSLHA